LREVVCEDRREEDAEDDIEGFARAERHYASVWGGFMGLNFSTVVTGDADSYRDGVSREGNFKNELLF
jgi:hypothetical protein